MDIVWYLINYALTYPMYISVPFHTRTQVTQGIEMLNFLYCTYAVPQSDLLYTLVL